jgi:hypothetical protein
MFGKHMKNLFPNHSNGNHVISKMDSHTTRFFLLGVTVFSSLLSGSTARSLSVAFSDRTFPCAIAVLGAILDCKKFDLNMYQGGISLSSYKKTGEKIVNLYKECV